MKTKATFQLPADLVERLQEAAADAEISQSSVVEGALRSALGVGKVRRDLVRGQLEKGPAGAAAVATALRKKGRTLEQIAVALNKKSFTTSRGREWSIVSVSRLLSPG